MSSSLYTDETPIDVKEAKGLHLITQSTPNGQKVQILLEELKDVYGTQWSFSLINIATNEQKKDWFLRLNPNGMPCAFSSFTFIHFSILMILFSSKAASQSLWTTPSLPHSPSWKHPRSCSTF